MPSKQTRRSISISGPTYDALKEHCKEQDMSMSGFVENLLKGTLKLTPQTEPLDKEERRNLIRDRAVMMF